MRVSRKQHRRTAVFVLLSPKPMRLFVSSQVTQPLNRQSEEQKKHCVTLNMSMVLCYQNVKWLMRNGMPQRSVKPWIVSLNMWLIGLHTLMVVWAAMLVLILWLIFRRFAQILCLTWLFTQLYLKLVEYSLFVIKMCTLGRSFGKT